MRESIQKQIDPDAAKGLDIDATRTSGVNLLRTTFSATLIDLDGIQKEFTGVDSIQKEWS